MLRIAAMLVLLVSAAAPLAAQTPQPSDRVVSELRAAVEDVQQRAARNVVRGMSFFSLNGGAAVSYMLQASLRGNGQIVPIDVVSAVRSDEHLMSLNVNSTLGRTPDQRSNEFAATFSFQTLEEFDAWYSSTAAQNLHRALEAAAQDGTVEVNLSVNGAASRTRSTVTEVQPAPVF